MPSYHIYLTKKVKQKPNIYIHLVMEQTKWALRCMYFSGVLNFTPLTLISKH